MSSTVIYEPRPAGNWGVSPKGHKHRMRIISWTLEGPLGVLTGCQKCSRTETVYPTKRMTKVRDGFTPETWAKLVEKAEERREALKEAA